jgi:glucose/arabinose dehydrogenase
LFVLEQDGFIRIIQNGELQPDPFMNLRGRMVDRMSDFDERGALGLEFHPDFANNGLFYVAYSRPLDPQGDLGKQLWWSHTNVVSEFKVSADDPNRADLSSERIISSIDWPQFNHNGHWIGFGPDGHALHFDRRRRLRQRLGHRPQRDARQRSGHDHAAGQDAACRRGRRVRRHPGRDNPFANDPTPCRRSGPRACATPGAARSTWAATTNSSAAT